MQKRDRRAKARNSEVREVPKPGRRPTPIWVTPRARSLLVFALLVLLALLAYAAPAVPLIAAGGFALALALSFPVRVISRFLPRPAAIVASFVLLILSSVLALSLLAPMLLDQMGALLESAPRLARQAEIVLRGVVEPLADRGLLPGTPDELLAGLAPTSSGASRTSFGTCWEAPSGSPDRPCTSSWAFWARSSWPRTCSPMPAR